MRVRRSWWRQVRWPILFAYLFIIPTAFVVARVLEMNVWAEVMLTMLGELAVFSVVGGES